MSAGVIDQLSRINLQLDRIAGALDNADEIVRLRTELETAEVLIQVLTDAIGAHVNAHPEELREAQEWREALRRGRNS